MLVRISNKIINTDLLAYANVRAIPSENKATLCVKMFMVFKNKSEVTVEFTTVLLNDKINLRSVENEVSERIFDLIKNNVLSIDYSRVVSGVLEFLSVK